MAPLISLYRTDHHSLVRWIGKTYGIHQDFQSNNPHRMRREVMARRLRLYRDAAKVDIHRVIDELYVSPEMRLRLRPYVTVAMEQNVTRRIVDEVASLYDRPAIRILGNVNQQERFRAEEKRLRIHEIAQESHRLVTLCNEVLEWQFSGIDGATKIRIVTPDTFDAIPHPSDALEAAGFLIDMRPTTMLDGSARARLPHYEMWDDTFRYLISAEGIMVDESGSPVPGPTEHGQGRIPGVLMHRREPTTTILDATHGSDIESAHLGVGILNVMIMRLSKSQGENQPVLQGNLANIATGQTMDGERPIMLPPEVVASMLQMKTDPDHYLLVKRDKITSVAQTYGMSYEQFTFQETADTASGKAYQVRREKLTEIRQESRRRAVLHESQRLELIGFDTTGLRIDYSEQAVPQDASEEVSLLRDKMKMGLDSPISYIMRKDTDLDRDAAVQHLKENLRDYAALIDWVRALNVPSGADAENPGQSPQQNGTANDSESKPVATDD